MQKRCFIFSFLVYSMNTFAIPIQNLESMLPAGSQLSLSIYDTSSKKSILTLDDDILLPPASTLKMATAIATTLAFPDNFTFKTKVYQSDKNIIFKFGGDPTLTRGNIRKLLQTIKNAGIKNIKGDILLDGTVFSGYEQAIGWPWDILGVCYSAPSSAISLDNNCVQGSIYSDKKKKITRVFVPQHHPVSISSDVIAVSKEEQKEGLCELQLHYSQENVYKLSGCLAYRNAPLALQFAIQNPTKYAQDVLRAEIKNAGIRFKGQIKTGQLNKTAKLITTHSSEPRDALLKRMLKDSDNLVADNLMKMIGHHYYKKPGTFSNGAMAMKMILKEKAGIDLTTAVITDGSGLSRNNRITGAQLIEILSFFYTKKGEHLVSMLPVSGMDGTLKYRHSVRYPPLKESLKAKTGSLFGSHNLAGIFTNEKGHNLLVVQLVSNYHPLDTGEEIDPSQTPITRFEKALFQALHNSSLTLHSPE